MLSYLHAFHAGNHADILKHAALIQLLKKLNQKPAPYSFFDTHAGSGLYSTSSEKARKTGEAQKGVLALAANVSQAQDAGAALSDYLDFVRPYLALDLYPGSPLIERAFLRPDDAHTICELHPTEYESLKENCARNLRLTTDTGAKTKIAAADKNSLQAQKGAAPDSRLATDTGSKPHTQILKADGLKTLLAQTPPKIKRGAVLIDPSYEEAGEYEAVSKTVVAVHKKWSAGIIMIWYPLLAHRSEEIERMIAAICAAAKNQNANTNILRAEFCVDTPQSHTEMSLEENAAAPSQAPRLYGSGILVINAPWKLDEELDAALEYLSRVPGLATEPSYSITKS